MTFILRWPAVLVLFALVLMALLGALAAAAGITGTEIPVAQISAVQAEANAAGAAQATWLDVGLLAGAAVFFLISAIRLIRRTQGFWTWLFGFACYGGRWAYAQGSEALAQIQGLNLDAYAQPQTLLADLGAPESQLAILGIVLIVGILILIIDGADRAYWERQAG
jgi:hypothetical protein